MNNVGNVVGLIKSLTPPEKTYILWAHILDENFPDVVVIKRYDFVLEQWVELGGVLPSQTIELTSGDMESEIVNAEELTVPYFNASTNLVEGKDFFFTGTKFTALFGTAEYIFLTGRLINDNGSIVLVQYSSVFDSSNGNFYVSHQTGYNALAQFKQYSGNNASVILMNTIDINQADNRYRYTEYVSGSQVTDKTVVIDPNNTNPTKYDQMIRMEDILGGEAYAFRPWKVMPGVFLGPDEFSALASGFELIPDLSNPNYYEEAMFRIEFVPGATPYTFASHFSIISNDGSMTSLVNIIGNLITGTEAVGITVRFSPTYFSVTDNDMFYQFQKINFTSNPGFAIISYDGVTNPGGGGDGYLMIQPYVRTAKYLPPF